MTSRHSNFEPSAFDGVDPTAAFLEKGGMCIGAALSLNLGSIAKKGGTAACTAITNLATKELTSAGTNVIAAKVSRNVTWYSSNCARRTAISQTAQKSLQTAEEGIIKKAALSGGAENINARVLLNKKLTSQEIAGGHAFGKHASEFGFKTKEQMALHIDKVLTNPTMVRQLSNGRTAFWHNASGSIVIRNPKAIDGGTTFVPKNGVDYFFNGLY